MMARVARVTVSSRRITTSPLLTRLPSRTRSSPTTPPVGCCTFLTLESTTTLPEAMSAPESAVVPAQPPTPPASSTKTARPASALRRMDRRVGEEVLDTLGTPGFRYDFEWRPRRRLAMGHFCEGLLLLPHRPRTTRFT